MSQCDNALFHVDSLTIDGVAIAIADASAEVEGLAGYENEAKPSAGNAPTAIQRKKVPCTINAQLQLTKLAQIDTIKNTCNAQIVLRDQHSGQRILFSKASFASMGKVGAGPVDIKFIATSQPQYL